MGVRGERGGGKDPDPAVSTINPLRGEIRRQPSLFAGGDGEAAGASQRPKEEEEQAGEEGGRAAD